MFRIRQESPALGIVPKTLWDDDWNRCHDSVWPEQQTRLNGKCRLVVQPLRAKAGNKFGNDDRNDVVVQFVVQFVDAIENWFGEVSVFGNNGV